MDDMKHITPLHKKSGFTRAFLRFKKNTLSKLGLYMAVGVILTGIFAPFIAPYPQDGGYVTYFHKSLQPPSWKHPFGTDSIGRDVFSRIILGTRISLMIGAVVLSLAVLVGVPLGLFAGYFRGVVEIIIMRIADIFLSIPALVLAMAVSALFKPNLYVCIGAIAFRWWAWYCRLAYGETLSIKQEDYIEAARSYGCSPIYMMAGEILPNMSSTIIVKISLDIGYAILTGATLGFLGLGAQPPTPEWGNMAAEGRHDLPFAWWTTTFSGLALLLTVLAFNLLGDGLRDYFDVSLEE